MMKKAAIIILFLMPFVGLCQQKKILFLGNSFVGYNNLPGMLYNLALSNGDTLVEDVFWNGSYDLKLHYQNPLARLKIKENNWDYVVIEEDGDEASMNSAYVDTTSYPYIFLLDSAIKANNPCTKTLLYLVWGRKYGYSGICPFDTAVCTYRGMQQRITDLNLAFRDNISAMVSPVGVAWQNCIAADSTLNLYAADNLHQNDAGQYLGACVFYSSIFGTSTVGFSYHATLTSPVAAFIQSISSHTVLDSLARWNIGVFDPHAGFSDVVNLLDVQFNNTSTNASTYLWDFGDGNTDITQNPLHSYTATGTYSVTLTVYSACSSNTIIQTVIVN